MSMNAPKWGKTDQERKVVNGFAAGDISMTLAFLDEAKLAFAGGSRYLHQGLIHDFDHEMFENQIRQYLV